ncbi:MAG TPA: hypothetical protein VJ306_17680 [Pyrinomonadaceae bacterium]|jgi:hypothetical protein|nr:hypothetical protein [Pyrinomonadaceae bacterium]
MAADTSISAAGARPVVTLTAGHPQRYSYSIVLQKPLGQTWPGGNPGKLILSGVFDKKNEATASVTLDDADTLDGCSLQWVVFVKVPGGGKGQFRVTVTVTQDDVIVGGPFTQSGVVDNVQIVSDFTDLKVT